MALLLSVSAAAAEGDLPPVGRSRFDYVIGDAPVPFPLSRLIAHVRSQLEASDDGLPPIKMTLIPIGRSLRRSVAAPDFFRFPSVVVAVDGHSKAGHAPMHDQMFIAYNERAESVEIISHNEQAGRFEFQVVRDYRPGTQPKLYYANRALCLACHQNRAPIFSRALWDETPANPAVATRLKAVGRDFYGIPIAGTDISNAIDAAAARANLFQVWQQIWRDACGAECRAHWLDAALSYAMSGNLPPADELKFTDLDKRWAKMWPKGLGILGSSIPNHDPFASAVEPRAEAHPGLPGTLDELARLARVPAQFEPLTPRPPVQTWTAPNTTQMAAGLAGLLNRSDVQAFDRALAMHAMAQPQILTLPCRFTPKPGRVVFDCVSPEARLSGILENAGGVLSAQIDPLQVGRAKSAVDVTLSGQTSRTGQAELIPRRANGPVRLSDGRRWSRLMLDTSQPGQGSATLTLVDDYAAVRAALPALPLVQADVFDGSRALAELATALGLPEREAAERRPLSGKLLPAKLEVAAPHKLSGDAERFAQYCGQCHSSAANVPPNFLQGDQAGVNARLDHCAERIFYRLSMWRLPEEKRGKTPMPPATELPVLGFDATGWTRSTPLAYLWDAARQRIRNQGGQPDAVLAQPFDKLRACLPATAP